MRTKWTAIVTIENLKKNKVKSWYYFQYACPNHSGALSFVVELPTPSGPHGALNAQRLVDHSS